MSSTLRTVANVLLTALSQVESQVGHVSSVTVDTDNSDLMAGRVRGSVTAGGRERKLELTVSPNENLNIRFTDQQRTSGCGQSQQRQEKYHRDSNGRFARRAA